MRKIHKIRTQANRRYRRHLRVRRKVAGSAERPRLVVFRSSKHIYAQIVDDGRGVTLVGAADTSEGLQLDGKGKKKGITKVVFDRGGYQYHGRVKAVADGARKGGLEL